MRLDFSHKIPYNILMTSDKKRQKLVNQAIANERLEGLEISPFAKKASDSYVAGKIPLEEASRQIRQRYGVL